MQTCMSRGPRGPMVRELSLSSMGHPSLVVSTSRWFWKRKKYDFQKLNSVQLTPSLLWYMCIHINSDTFSDCDIPARVRRIAWPRVGATKRGEVNNVFWDFNENSFPSNILLSQIASQAMTIKQFRSASTGASPTKYKSWGKTTEYVHQHGVVEGNFS